jgi:hypothetical protein
MTFYLLAILLPKPDRLARVQSPPLLQSSALTATEPNADENQVEEIAKEAADYVQKNEPNTLKYQWFKTGTAEQPKIVVWEAYVLSSWKLKEADVLTLWLDTPMRPPLMCTRRAP